MWVSQCRLSLIHILAAITAKDSFDENKENIAAVEKDNFVLKAYLSYNYPQWKVMEYETSDAAVKAMQKGEADCIVSNSGTVSDYLKNNKLHSVFLTKEDDVSFAEDVQASLDAGMNTHLSKPIVIEEVIKTILRYVHND